MKYEITPLQGMDDVRFGMDIHEVRRIVGADFKSFKRTPNSTFPCDYFSDLGTFAYYDSQGKLEAIELASPATPVLEGTNLLDAGFDAVVAFLRSRDVNLVLESDGAISKALGVSLYAPQAANDSKAPSESVLIFASGYYD